jgi:asparagine synthase (glutamine-hydrolysing)
MCGICGWVSLVGQSIDPTVLEKMVSIQKHRGPDDRGYWYSDNIALGHTRLSIIDIKNGAQPMADNDGLVIVFNGEIYNYLEIRKVLTEKGAIFRTQSDTEVILESYKAWGEQCVSRFNGMFSFVIVDKRKQLIFLARDRFGKKPLHYFYHNGEFIFASEIKAILQNESVRSNVDVDDSSLIDYLSLGYVLSPKTIYKEIRRFPAASWGYLNLTTGNFSITRYWNFEDYYKLSKTDKTADQCVDEFNYLFSKAIKTRLQADVPVGAFLSSGIDSTSVVAGARAVGNGDLRAFNIGFREESYDESIVANRIASELGTNLEIRIFERCSKSDISQLVWHFDEPFSDNSSQPTYQLNRLAGEFGKVALSGDGADELFAGYPTYRADQLFQLYRKLPLYFQKTLQSSARKWLRPTYRKVSWDYKIRQFLGSIGLSREEAHYWWRVIFSVSEVHSILNQEVLEEQNGYSPFVVFRDLFNSVKDISFLDQTLYVDAQTWLLDDILVKVDRMSMAHSVEVRCPFLDHELAEFAARLPTKMKINARKNKVIIRDSMPGGIPNSVRDGRKKGFNSPPINDLHLSMPIDRRFQKQCKLDQRREDVTFKMNNLLALSIWFDMFKKYKETGRWESIKYDG